MTALIPMPLCQTCAKPVKTRWRTKGKPTKFCSAACIPRQLRVEAGQKGRKKFIVQRRLALFRRELQRLQALERITAQELTATFAAIAERCWDNGYSTCETKWLRRKRQEQAA
jgi:hypothetical protein